MARPTSLPTYGVCLIFVILGCLLRSWAAGYLFKGKRVAVGGPYAFIRNPLYVGSFIIGVGFCVALWRWPLPWAPLVLMIAFILGFGVVYRAKTLAEEKELEANLQEPYRIYARQVPPFLPSKGHVVGLGTQRFSWELYRRNKEYECLVGSSALLLFLFWRFHRGF